MHPNGLYSAFGRDDGNGGGGGTWLSAFVLTSLIEIRKNKFIQIDDEKLRLTFRSLIARKSTDGSYRQQNGAQLFSKALAGALMLDNEQSFVGLTAYVTVALMKCKNELFSSNDNESSLQYFDREIEHSIEYLSKNINNEENNNNNIKKLNTVDLAMTFYALSIYNNNNNNNYNRSINQIVKKLESEIFNQRAFILKDDKETTTEMYWKLKATTTTTTTSTTTTTTNKNIESVKSAADLEVTSYILQAMLLNLKATKNNDDEKKETRRRISKLLPIVKWIVGQSNSQGGFYSTQVSKIFTMIIIFVTL